MNEDTPERRGGRIVVALDASPYSLAALRTAAELAMLLDIELEGIFIEDINLLHLCGFPFGQEIGSYTATVRRVDNVGVERQLRALANVIQQSMSQMATRMPVRWRFNVRRGAVVRELLEATQNAHLLSLGRSGQLRREALGSTASALVKQSQRPLLLLGISGGLVYPLVAIYTGTAAAKRALEWMATLASYNPQPVRVLVVAPPDASRSLDELKDEASAILGDHAVEFVPVRYGNILMTLRIYDGGTLVLSSEQTDFITGHPGPTVIVP